MKYLKNHAEGWAVASWLALPLLGQLTAPFYVLSAPFLRNVHGRFRSNLLLLTGLCAVYVAYVALVSLLAPNARDAAEPIGDAASLLITVALATWVLRGAAKVDLGLVYRACVVLLLTVFVLVLAEAAAWPNERSSLVMGNPLNLSAVLIVPALLCTYRRFAPSLSWQVAGGLAFLAALYVLAVPLAARGSTITLLALVCLRVLWLLLAHRALRFGILTGLAATIVSVAALLQMPASQGAMDRFRDVARLMSTDLDAISLEDVQDRSLQQRLAMLQGGWRAFRDSPWLGHGGQNRFSAAAPYLPSDFTEEYSHLHNDFLTHAVAGGVPAVFLLVILLIFPVAIAGRSEVNRLEKYGLALVFTGAFTGTALFNNVLFVDISAFSFGLSLVIAVLLIESA